MYHCFHKEDVTEVGVRSEIFGDVSEMCEIFRVLTSTMYVSNFVFTNKILQQNMKLHGSMMRWKTNKLIIKTNKQE